MIFLIYYTKSTCIWSGRFSSAAFLRLSFLMYLFPFLASLLRELDEEEPREKVELILLLFLLELLSEDIDFFSYVFVGLSLFLKDLHCHLHYLPSYFSANLRKKRFSQIWELRPLHVWIAKESEETKELGLTTFG